VSAPQDHAGDDWWHTLADDEGHEELREWLGDDFDPAVFDFAAHAAPVAVIGNRPGRAEPTPAG